MPQKYKNGDKSSGFRIFDQIFTKMRYSDRIIINPNIRFGRPCVKGTRISVYDVLSWLASGMSHEQIVKDYPELKEEDIKACLAFAADKEHKLRVA